MTIVDAITFSRNLEGDVCISFEDTAFARAEAVFVHPSKMEITALIDGHHVRMGELSEALADTFMENHRVILKGPHPLGYDVTLEALVQTLH